MTTNFEDVVGVTVSNNTKPSTVSLKVSSSLYPYIENKPIHGSQRVMEKNDAYTIIELTVQINYEFISQIFSYGESITVNAPEELKQIIKSKAKKILENYK